MFLLQLENPILRRNLGFYSFSPSLYFLILRSLFLVLVLPLRSLPQFLVLVIRLRSLSSFPFLDPCLISLSLFTISVPCLSSLSSSYFFSFPVGARVRGCYIPHRVCSNQHRCYNSPHSDCTSHKADATYHMTDTWLMRRLKKPPQRQQQTVCFLISPHKGCNNPHITYTDNVEAMGVRTEFFSAHIVFAQPKLRMQHHVQRPRSPSSAYNSPMESETAHTVPAHPTQRMHSLIGTCGIPYSTHSRLHRG